MLSRTFLFVGQLGLVYAVMSVFALTPARISVRTIDAAHCLVVATITLRTCAMVDNPMFYILMGGRFHMRIVGGLATLNFHKSFMLNIFVSISVLYASKNNS